ncbi:helix-turn-helix domain-containing protein [Halegenticoccus tardaugens]|uniref:helix-turn-helix domain-containing protein n=1 Tax=Halegenticoccus tardaugens TaxID=2071624 RepID=UPI00100BFDB2|nr:helix-turn-helix domain-containing protein [Halegenticoccus tardaugens]
MISAEFLIKLDLLNESLDRASDVTLSIESGQFPFVGEKNSKLLVWASGGDLDRFESSTEDDPTVMEVTPLATRDSKRLYRIDFPRDELESLFDTLFYDHDTLLVDGVITADGWDLRMRALDKSAISRVYDELQERGHAVHFHSIHSECDDHSVDAKLSEAQYEALSAAFERGYYDVPRETNLEELAEEFPVSSQALSERLRRATAAVLEDALDDAAVNADG